MTFSEFVFLLQLHQVPTEAVEACEDWITINTRFYFSPKAPKIATHDLGYAELADITSKAQSIQEIVNAIYNATVDYDSCGRDISKMRYAQLVKKPNKTLKRRVLKSYYLHLFNLDQEPKPDTMWGNLFDHSVDSLYNLNAFAH